jgi:hypothetical protein
MITTAKDVYTWRVTYYDGSTLDEYDESRPDGRGFAEIGEQQFSAVELIGTHRVSVPFGATPVFFRRRRTELNPNSDEETHSTIHCIGWKKDDQACYLFIRDDGRTLMSTDLQAI